MPYLDTSVLGSYYCVETLSPAVHNALASVSQPMISPLVEVELMSLLSLKVRNRDIDRASADRVRIQFQRHRSEHLYKVADLGKRDFAVAQKFLNKFTSPLRAMDAIHLATAMLHRQQLWTTDKPMAQAAKILRINCLLIHL